MILQSLTVTDFRQFRGTHRIEFAVPNKNSTRNTTVIHGSGGSGKSNLIRALGFALLGEACHPPEVDQLPEGQSLVNHQALRSARGQDDLVEAVVEVVFKHRQRVYTLRRTVIGRWRAGAVVEEPGLVQMEVRDLLGRTEVITDPQAVAQTAADIAGPSARIMFFDPERAGRETACQDTAEGVGEMLAPVADRFRCDGGTIRPGDSAVAMLSVGQQQMMALAGALVRLRGSAEPSEAPFITDDPLATLDAEFREQAIRMVPEQCSQWVLLTSRLGPAEADLLRSGGRWGKSYELREGEDGSRIEKVNVVV